MFFNPHPSNWKFGIKVNNFVMTISLAKEKDKEKEKKKEKKSRSIIKSKVRPFTQELHLPLYALEWTD